MIPRNVHFIFLSGDEFSAKPFSYFHYLCLKSCYITQKFSEMIIHVVHEPSDNIWWNRAREFCRVVKYPSLPKIVYRCNGRDVWRVEHKCDIFRLLILKEHGGVYADVDTLFYKQFPSSWFDEQFVIGTEYGYKNSAPTYITGLGNALMMSHSNSEFLDHWIECYKYNYDSEDWSMLSLRAPHVLANRYPALVHIEPVESFHKYGWEETFYTNGSGLDDTGIYTKHLAQSVTYKLLTTITEENVRTDFNLFSKMCCAIDGLLE